MQLTLAGANSYSGGTTVNAGTLIMTSPTNNFAAGGLTVAGGAAFNYQPSVAGGLNFPGDLTLADGSTIGTGIAGTASQSAITVGGNATLSGNVTVNIYGIPGTDPTAGSNTLISAPSATGSGLAGAVGLHVQRLQRNRFHGCRLYRNRDRHLRQRHHRAGDSSQRILGRRLQRCGQRVGNFRRQRQ